MDYPLTLRHRDGRETLTEVLYNALVYRDTSENVLGALAAARDVTAQMQAQREVVERLAELEELQRLASATSLGRGPMTPLPYLNGLAMKEASSDDRRGLWPGWRHGESNPGPPACKVAAESPSAVAEHGRGTPGGSEGRLMVGSLPYFSGVRLWAQPHAWSSADRRNPLVNTVQIPYTGLRRYHYDDDQEAPLRVAHRRGHRSTDL